MSLLYSDLTSAGLSSLADLALVHAYLSDLRAMRGPYSPPPNMDPRPVATLPDMPALSELIQRSQLQEFRPAVIALAKVGSMLAEPKSVAVDALSPPLLVSAAPASMWSPRRCLWVIAGESFRWGGQGTRTRDTPDSHPGQMAAHQSQMDFMDWLQEEHGIECSVVLTQYASKYREEVETLFRRRLRAAVWPSAMVAHSWYGDRILDDALHQPGGLEQFEFVQHIRADVLLRPMMRKYYTTQPNTFPNRIMYTQQRFHGGQAQNGLPLVSDFSWQVPTHAAASAQTKHREREKERERERERERVLVSSPLTSLLAVPLVCVLCCSDSSSSVSSGESMVVAR